MIILRILAVVFWLLTAVTLGADLLGLAREGAFEATALGTWWYELHSASLSLAQSAIQRYVLAELWDPVIVTVLLWPAFAVFGGLAVLFTVFSSKRGRRRLFARR